MEQMKKKKESNTKIKHSVGLFDFLQYSLTNWTEMLSKIPGYGS